MEQNALAILHLQSGFKKKIHYLLDVCYVEWHKLL